MLVEVRDLRKAFIRPQGVFRPPLVVRAVDGVSFDIAAGETFGLVGESGSGKSTTGRCLLRLIEPTAGDVRIRGLDVLRLPPAALRRARRHMQMIFQDPETSLNPRMRAGAIVEEPLVIHGIGTRLERHARVDALLAIVGLEPAHRHRYPREFSGGQRQRIAIARALALDPAFIVADEAVSALDMSVQAQIVRLLLELQARLSLTYLFIAHDLRLVRDICSRVAVMYLGRIVEIARTAALFTSPRHPYTQALLSAIPGLDPDAPRRRVPFDPATFDPALPLREVAAGHYAAI